MPEVMIREAAEGDLPAILTLYAQPDMDSGEVLDLLDAQRMFQRIHTYPNYRVFVAEHEGVIIGTFALLIMDNLAHLGARTGIVEDVVVSSTWQRRGVGKQMMQYAIVRCREYQCYKLMLSSNLKRRDAHRFYESLCFKPHGYSYVVDFENDG